MTIHHPIISPTVANSEILRLHRELCRSQGMSLRAMAHRAAEERRIRQAILAMPAGSFKAVCVQLDVVWSLHGEAETFNLDRFAVDFQNVCEGARRALGVA